MPDLTAGWSRALQGAVPLSPAVSSDAPARKLACRAARGLRGGLGSATPVRCIPHGLRASQERPWEQTDGAWQLRMCLEPAPGLCSSFLGLVSVVSWASSS